MVGRSAAWKVATTVEPRVDYWAVHSVASRAVRWVGTMEPS